MKRAGEPVCRRHIVSSFVRDAPRYVHHPRVTSPSCRCWVVVKKKKERRKRTKGRNNNLRLIKYYWDHRVLNFSRKEFSGNSFQLASFVIGIGGRDEDKGWYNRDKGKHEWRDWKNKGINKCERWGRSTGTAANFLNIHEMSIKRGVICFLCGTPLCTGGRGVIYFRRLVLKSRREIGRGEATLSSSSSFSSLDTARDPGNLHSGRWNSPVRFCTLLRGWERQRNGLKNLLRGRS